MDPHNDETPDEEDDAPLEVSKQSSEQQAKESFKQEKFAQNLINEKIKQKRRQELERFVEQKKKKIEKLPENFFDVIETELKKNNQSDQSNNAIDKATLKPSKRKKKKMAKIKKLATKATNYEVLSIDQLAKISAAPILHTDAYNFREKMLFDKKKNVRLSSRRAKSMLQKIHVCKR